MSKFVFNELHTGDAAAAQKFYQGVFGWSFDSVPMPNGAYIFIKSGDDGIGGVVQHDDGRPPQWLNYVGVDSVKRTMNKATRRGAEVVMGYTKVPTMGALAILKDPTGAVFAVWEQARQPAAKKKAAAKKKTTKKAAAKRVAKKATAKKTAAKKTTRKKAAAKKTAAKKATRKKATAKKTTRKKAAVKKTTRKKAAAKKTTRKAAAKKTTSKKVAAKKTKASRKRGAKKK